MVNRNIFRETYQLFDQDVIIEIINIYIDEYPGKLERLAKNIEERDFKALRFTAHNLKGVISNFSAPEAFEMIKNFEKTAVDLFEEEGKEFNEAAIKNQLSEINATVIKVGEDLKKIKQEMLSGDFIFDPNG
ncbi:MAG: Hpt domain-containing protein [Lentimicrobium sp.]|jgi:HPt (histidine-containing phosphotransfer) domain-containing protein|nr:Hpt domain-containing protein [Lentimicrobium sp.]